MTAGLYVHIPFCDIRCGYCDFFTVTGLNAHIPNYLSALKRELDLYSYDSYYGSRTYATLYFGGGTPSLLAPDQIASIKENVFAKFNFTDDVEVTLETNPGTVDYPKLCDLRAAGVTRLSFGIQSFHEQELRFLDRDHSVRDSLDCFDAARKAGFDNISLDLIYSLPDQIEANWRQSLLQAVALQPEHISAYNLTYESGTPLTTRLQKGAFKVLPEEPQRSLQLSATEILTRHGLQQYEISNFSKPGYESIHNRKYWDGSPYLGAGVSAHSFAENKRFWNVRNLHGYIKTLQNNTLPVDGRETLTENEIMFERIYLGLRQNQGFRLSDFESASNGSFFERYKNVMMKFFQRSFDANLQADLTSGKRSIRSRLLIIENGFVRLSEEGILLCDAICAEFV